VAEEALVIGGTGQVGYAVTRELRGAGWEVAVAARGHHEPPPDLDAHLLVLDREDSSSLARAARGRDLVVDTVAFTPDHAHQLLQLDVGGLVVVSTAAVYQGSNGTYLDVVTGPESFPDYPGPITEDWPTVDNSEPTYAPLKSAMERVLLEGHLPVSILRAGAIHGPHSTALREWFFIKRALDRRTRVLLSWGGRGRFHPASTANIAALVLACSKKIGNHVLNAVDDDCPTDAEICETIFEAMGQAADIVTFPGPPRGDVGASPWSVPKPFVLSMARARTEVDYTAAMTYRESVRIDINWVIRAVEQAEARGGSWRDVFPSLVHWGADQWFNYDDEDSLLSERMPHADRRRE
jgi:nucleoside-diphosphate-sugar epimerase